MEILLGGTPLLTRSATEPSQSSARSLFLGDVKLSFTKMLS